MSTTVEGAGVGPRGLQVLWKRQISAYPSTARRYLYLAITVLATIVLYYELYIQSAVATKLITHFHFSLTSFIFVLVVANCVGAFASLFAGLADRWGRANLVAAGVIATGLLVEFALPNATSKTEWYVLVALINLVEGMALVATPALIRDFSPQLGRASAMGFWTMGPVLGSLVVTEVSSHTLASHPGWQYQFQLCGVIGLIVAAITVAGLRELSPALRDQLMVSVRDRELIEARAAGLDTETVLEGSWRRMLKPRIVGPALGVSLFLMLYYVAVALLVVYFATTYGWSASKSNDVANYWWGANVIAVILTGALSDRLLVRKPLFVLGCVVSLIGTAFFATTATKTTTSAGTIELLFIVIAAGTGIAYVTWMAAYTETVEKINPAATATGLAIWGWTIRIVVTVSYAVAALVLPASNTLVDQGTQVSAIIAKYPAQVKTLQTVDPTTMATLKLHPTSPTALPKALSEISGLPDATVAKVLVFSTTYKQQLATAAVIKPATLAALTANPTNTTAATQAVVQISKALHVTPAVALARLQALAKVPKADLALLKQDGARVTAAGARLKAIDTVPAADLAYLSKYGTKVAQAQKDNPGQWQTWWWVCFAAQLLFIPLALMLRGPWSPRAARRETEAHEQLVAAELDKLHARDAG